MRYRKILSSAIASVVVCGLACSSSDTGTLHGSGGAGVASGGASGSGGSSSSGPGGSANHTNQPVGLGGASASGGAGAEGSTTSGKHSDAGTGTTGSGGRASTGGSTGTGGSSGTGGRKGVDGGTVTPGAGGTTGSGGSTAPYVGDKTPGTAQSGDITVDPGKLYQVVDGFGFADVWQDSSSTAMQTLLFDPENGIGLNLLRIGIESKSGTSVLMGKAGVSDGQACVKYAGADCKIWAAPWSPPAAMKNNNNVNGSGNNSCSNTTDTLKTDSYEAWATLLAAFPAYYKKQGGPDLFAVSAQNEPDWNPNYEACCYDKTQMVNFINVLGPKLAALDPPVKLLAAEPDNWVNLWGGDAFGTAILGDAKASANVTIIATHDYGSSGNTRPSPPASNTHHLWETECTPGDKGAITIATMIYAAFTTGGVNGWHYWWTQELVPNASSPPTQVYALGNYSKFVRPGYSRADVSGAPKSGPLISAFTSPTDGTVSIVVVNSGSAQQLSFFVAGKGWPASVTPYVTTDSSKLAAGTAIAVTAGRFSASLTAKSVTTFVGKP